MDIPNSGEMERAFGDLSQWLIPPSQRSGAVGQHCEPDPSAMGESALQLPGGTSRTLLAVPLQPQDQRNYFGWGESQGVPGEPFVVMGAMPAL